MKRYLYNYQTITRFDVPVNSHFFLLRCMPCVSACQQIGKREFFLYPDRSHVIYGADAWGTPIQYGNIMRPHDAFVFVSSGEARLETYRIPDVREPHVFLAPSALTVPSEAIRQFAATHRNSHSPRENALSFSQAIYRYMMYTPGSTGAATTAAESFAQRMGVCQDYAHILIACCRAEGIPARYANGFLPGLGSTHAWVEIYDEGAWWGIDPTNDTAIDFGYIKIAHGRDAADCPVNRGTFLGAAQQQTEIRVVVEEL